ncbi:MAG: 3-oxo-tetronate kinase [Planctomycetota bacterium]
MAEDHPTENPPLLGCIADDVTGATDLAINLVQGGMRVVQVMGVPTAKVLQHADGADALVVALKTRSIPAAYAVQQSLASLEALQSIGCSRFYFKYCSTFDSTPAGNIGPVAEALADALSTAQTIYCPAFPRAGRTVYRGHLFVFDRLLNDSGMQNHPLTPMTDADLVRVLAPQTTRPVGLVDYDTPLLDAEAVRSKLNTLAEAGVANVVTDACDDVHLRSLAHAVTSMPLVTGGSGLARYLPEAYRQQGLLSDAEVEPYVPDAAGRALVLSGSCSRATQGQVKWAEGRLPMWPVDIPALLEDPAGYLDQVCAWIEQQDASQPAVVASTASPEKVSALQAQHGTDAVASAVETLMGRIAVAAVERCNVRRILVAGGETSGAVAAALNVDAVQIGPEIATGVSWTQTLGQSPAVALAFKSGNFGQEDIFTTAWEKLP